MNKTIKVLLVLVALAGVGVAISQFSDAASWQSAQKRGERCAANPEKYAYCDPCDDNGKYDTDFCDADPCDEWGPVDPGCPLE